MATAKFRHHNSPEEVARRAGVPDPQQKATGFRHYNHPEEVAKRAAAGQSPQGARGVLPVARQAFPDFGQVDWPPAGQPNNAPLPYADPEPLSPVETTSQTQRRGILPSEAQALADLLYALVSDEAEARQFRRLLNNQQAVTDALAGIDGAPGLIARVKALEVNVEALGESFDGLVDDLNTEPEAEPHRDTEPPPPIPNATDPQP